jgi:hypothetical protein
MVYFKKVELSQYSYDQIENGLRKVSLKRTSSLDIVSPVSDIGSDKYFLGREHGNSLTFTRIRTSFERFLPRAIIKLTPDSSFYELRLSLISTIAFAFFGVILPVFAILVGLSRNGPIEGTSFFIVVTIVYILLIMLELRLVRLKVNKALTQYAASRTSVS